MSLVQAKFSKTEFPIFASFGETRFPGSDAETIRKEVAEAKEKLKKHPKFFERFGSTRPRRKSS